MLLKMMKSKLHRVTITDAKLDYPGSVGIDAELMEKIGLLPYEAVTIANINNGNRLETYAVPNEAGSKTVTILGAAAKLVNKGDVVIIFSFAMMTLEEAQSFEPKALAFDENNNIIDMPKRS